MSFTNSGQRDLNTFLIKRESTPGNVGPGLYDPGKNFVDIIANKIYRHRNPKILRIQNLIDSN